MIMDPGIDGCEDFRRILEQHPGQKAILCSGYSESDHVRMSQPGRFSQVFHLKYASKPYFDEIFVMDNQGANVAMTDKTSDYWQGDEAKFIKSFNGGHGAIFVDQVKFDDSSQAYLAQVSVPVWDGDKVIGAITFGIDVDKVQ
jgi:hypothetical protein